MTTKEFNDKLKRLQEKDYKALEDIYNVYYSLLYATAYSVCNNKADAEDVASNIIYKLTQLKTYEYIKNPRGYLYTITRHSALDYKKQQKEVPLLFVEQCESKTEFEAEIHIESCLSKLPDMEKTIVVEYVFAKFRFKEIAQRHNLSVATVKRRYKKAKLILQDLLK